MRFIGYDSIQSRWLISYCFQIRTITGVTLQYPALKRFLLVSADRWHGSSTPTWTWLWCKCLAISHLPLDKAHFLRWVVGNSIHHHLKPYVSREIGCWKFFMLPLRILSISWYGTFFWDASLKTYHVIFWSPAHLVKWVIFRDGSVMASHFRGKAFNRSLLVTSQIELTIERLESYSVRLNHFQQPT